MRLLFPVVAVLSATAFAHPAAAPIAPGQRPSPIAGNDCPRATPYLTHQDVGRWRVRPLQPRKLGELPPAENFAAVVRTDDRGCLVPVKYPPTRR